MIAAGFDSGTPARRRDERGLGQAAPRVTGSAVPPSRPAPQPVPQQQVQEQPAPQRYEAPQQPAYQPAPQQQAPQQPAPQRYEAPQQPAYQPAQQPAPQYAQQRSPYSPDPLTYAPSHPQQHVELPREEPQAARPAPEQVQVPRVIELPHDTAAASRRPVRARRDEDDLDVPDFLK